MFNMGSRQMEKMMKQMGIQNEIVDAVEVIIKGKDKEIVISNPQVTKITMQGQDTYQVVGEVSEKSAESFSEEDVKMIVEQTGASEEEAKSALEETGDIAEAILKLKKE
ncbi:MAG: nascent polypeptide-associated complex protein [Candidatus Aenigmarchaeota archaeon]|nr:nascent polypeptide-associated complex protein [Candidatus Aenigmarchaeota archaeon]